VTITTQSAYNHVCGCTKCWKPMGAMFSQVAAVPRDKFRVTKNADKLKIVDTNAAVQRYACETLGGTVKLGARARLAIGHQPPLPRRSALAGQGFCSSPRVSQATPEELYICTLSHLCVG
jgi:hypothetical protein